MSKTPWGDKTAESGGPATNPETGNFVQCIASGIDANGQKYVLYEIPDHVLKKVHGSQWLPLTPSQARHLANELWKVADKIDGILEDAV